MRAIQAATSKTQARFAADYRLPVGTVRDREQGRRQPDAPARVLLGMIQREPDMAERLVTITQVKRRSRASQSSTSLIGYRSVGGAGFCHRLDRHEIAYEKNG